MSSQLPRSIAVRVVMVRQRGSVGKRLMRKRVEQRGGRDFIKLESGECTHLAQSRER
jgi:hypothetical protein